MKTRTQINVMVAYMDDMTMVAGDLRPHLNVKASDLFAMSENQVFRNMNFIKATLVENAIGEMETVLYGKFLVLRNDRRQVDLSTDTRPEDFLDFGMVVHFDEELTKVFGYAEVEYKRALRSASQFRTAKLLATESTLVDEVRSSASYGWINRIEGLKMKSVAKVEPYIGLALSSTVTAGKGFTCVNVDDYTSTVDITGAMTMDNSSGVNVIIRYDEYEQNNTSEMDLTDGQALISPKAMAKAAFESGIIYKSDFAILRAAFAQGLSFSAQLTDATTGPIWVKIPRGIQFRYGLKKGFAVIVDHSFNDAKGKQFDLVFPDGANKGEVKRFENRFIDGQLVTKDHGSGASDAEVELAIANVSATKEKYWGLLNYQFIMSLTLDFTNDIQVLATKAIQNIMKALESPESAMAFIGMIDNGDDEEYAERNAVQKIREILESNPRIFYTKWMQAKIKQLMTKSMDDMRRGRIPVEDSRFVFIITDPATLEGGPLLAKGECYYNGSVGERAIFRSPLIHKSEAVVINLVSRPELDEAFGHLSNILIMNAFDDTLPRMGGADTDGDKVYLTSEPIIVNAVERDLPMVYGDVASQQMEEFEWKNGCADRIQKYDLNTLVPSAIGQVTNYCTSIADKARDIRSHADQIDGYWNLVTLGRILQGKIIDDAKRGTTTNIDSRLKVQFYPTWLESGKNRYESFSPMGRLYTWITKIVMPAFKDKYGAVKTYRENILMDYTNYSPVEMNGILGQIAELEESYRQDVAAFFADNGDEPDKESYESLEDYKEESDRRSQMFLALVERHQLLLSTVNASTSTIGMACIHVAENLPRTGAGKIASYPFVVATEYVKALLSELPNNFKLVRAHDVDGGLWSTSVEVSDGTVLNADGEEVATVRGVENGTYETSTFKTSFFLKVNTEVKSVEVARSETKLVQFELKGFKYSNLTEGQVLDLIAHKTVSLQKIVNENGNWLGVIFQGQQIGAVGKETFLDVNFAQGKELKVIALQPIKGIIKVTAEIGTEHVEVTTNLVEQHEEIVVSSGQMDMFDMSVGM
jgi:hypothetical protein